MKHYKTAAENYVGIKGAAAYLGIPLEDSKKCVKLKNLWQKMEDNWRSASETLTMRGEDSRESYVLMRLDRKGQSISLEVAMRNSNIVIREDDLPLIADHLGIDPRSRNAKYVLEPNLVIEEDKKKPLKTEKAAPARDLIKKEPCYKPFMPPAIGVMLNHARSNYNEWLADNLREHGVIPGNKNPDAFNKLLDKFKGSWEDLTILLDKPYITGAEDKALQKLFSSAGRTDVAAILRNERNALSHTGGVHHLTNRIIAKDSGLPLGRVCAIFSGEVLPSKDELAGITDLLGIKSAVKKLLSDKLEHAAEKQAAR